MTSRRNAVTERNWSRYVLVAAVLVIAVLGAPGLWAAADSSAAGAGPVGFVDVAKLIDDYLAPIVDGPLQEETLRLQAEFEEAARELDEQAAEELFERYQTMLNLVKHDLIEEQLPVINAAIGAVAEREAITVVLDKQSVLHGGVDLTVLVLEYLQD